MANSRSYSRRYQAMVLGVAAGVAVAALAAGLAEPLRAPRWLTISLAIVGPALAFAAAYLAWRQKRHEDQEFESAWDAKIQEALPAGAADTVAETDPYRAGLVTDARRARIYQRPGEARPPYLARTLDGPLEQALQQPVKRVFGLRLSLRYGSGL